MSDLNRRQFVIAAATAAAACACNFCPSAAMAAGRSTSAPAAGPHDAGALADITKDGFDDRFAAQGFILVRENGKIYAISNVCTHERGRLRVDPDVPAQLKCVKHKATFDTAGSVTGGPAKRALPRYAVRADEQGHLIVDTSRTFTDKQHDDPASFVAAGH